MLSREHYPLLLFSALGLDLLIVSHFDALIMYTLALVAMIVYLVKAADSRSVKVWVALYAVIVFFSAFSGICAAYSLGNLGLSLIGVFACPVYAVMLLVTIWVHLLIPKEPKQEKSKNRIEEEWTEGGFP